MSMHLLAYLQSIAQNSELSISLLTDDVFPVQNSQAFVQDPVGVQWTYAQSTTLLRARLDQPSMRKFTLPHLSPVNQGATPGDLPPICYFGNNPLPLIRGENLGIRAFQGGAGAETVIVGVGLIDSYAPPRRGQAFTLRGTSTTAATANVWSTIVHTWEDTLPNGRYQVVGGLVEGAASVLFRLRFNQQTWRPGGACTTGPSQEGHAVFRRGGLGSWGEFDNINPPEVQVLATAATASWVTYLDLIAI